MMATMDSSAVNVSLPTIARLYQASLNDVEWVIVSYLLTMAALLLPFGRLGDQWGRKKLFRVGMVFFTVSSIFCALSLSVPQLVVSRIIQGIGGAIFISITPAILVDSFPTSERGKAIGLMGTIVSTGLMVGAPLGGFLTHYLSWMWIFLINIPIGILGYFLAGMNLPKDPVSDKKIRFDFPGALSIVLASSTFLFALNKISTWGMDSVWTLGLFCVSFLLFIQFLKIEHKNPLGVLDLNLFRRPLILGGSFSLLFHFMALFILYFLTPFYLTEVLHLKPHEVGLTLMFFSIGFAMVTPISGWLSDKVGSRILSPVGLSLLAILYFGASTLNERSQGWHVSLLLMLVGACGGLFQAPNNSALLGAVQRPHLGTVSSIIATMRTFGIMMGVAFGTLLFSLYVQLTNGLGKHFTPQEVPAHLFVGGYHFALLCAAAIACIAVFFSLYRVRPEF